MQETAAAVVICDAGGVTQRGASREQFLAGCLTERTRRAYRRDLEDFFAFVGVATPAELTPERVTACRNQLMAQGARPATVARKLTVVRAFCEHLVYHGGLDGSTTEQADQPAFAATHGDHAGTG